MRLQARKLRTQDRKQLHKEYGKESAAVLRLMRRSLKARDIAEELPRRIVAHLNGQPRSAAVKRVARFIQLFRRARELNDSFRVFFESRDDMVSLLRSPSLAVYTSNVYGTGWTFKSPELQALNDELNRVLTGLNKLAKRYWWHPLIRHQGYEIETFDIAECDATEWRSWETRAIWWLCMQDGKWIDFFRQCGDCRRWFFAVADHQSYCGSACRQRHASCSDEFKQRRRLYMRGYRQDEKDRDRRAKNQVRSPKKTK
jgi:hypothetical protein